MPFADFWALWRTTKRYDGKDDAIRAWAKIPAAYHGQIMKRLRIAIEVDWKGKNITYIPHASTWLNSRRWEDEVPVEATSVEQVPPPRPFLTGTPKFEPISAEERETIEKVWLPKLREARERYENAVRRRSRLLQSDIAMAVFGGKSSDSAS